MTVIVVGSTLKGIVTGALAGLIARRKQSLWVGLLAGLVIGFILSSLAAVGQPAHYWAIVFPGMVLGLIVGFVTQRYPHGVTGTTSSRSVPLGRHGGQKDPVHQVSLVWRLWSR